MEAEASTKRCRQRSSSSTKSLRVEPIEAGVDVSSRR